MNEPKSVEPWLRGTLTEIPSVTRGVMHALQLAEEDLHKWCDDLTDEDLNARPADLAPVAFHIRHIARSLDRLLAYAEGKSLDAEQLAALKTELEPGAPKRELFAELTQALQRSAHRVRVLCSENLEAARKVGSRKLPTTLGGLLVHIADHTQRHVGQAITTAKLVVALKDRPNRKL